MHRDQHAITPGTPGVDMQRGGKVLSPGCMALSQGPCVVRTTAEVPAEQRVRRQRPGTESPTDCRVAILLRPANISVATDRSELQHETACSSTMKSKLLILLSS